MCGVPAMNDLGVNLDDVRGWFQRAQEAPYVLVRVSDEHAKGWAAALGLAVRRCYLTDALLAQRAAELKVTQADIIAAKMPDPGSTMAGDFGEILCYLYQGAGAQSASVAGATKWRLKQDRTKPAPHSDVVHFVVPTWPAASSDDVILCSEVKTKSTAGTSTPIKSAIEDCMKDRTSRLAKTLVWLRERAYGEDLGAVTLAHLERFINTTDYLPAQKKFSAVAIVSAELVDKELADAPSQSDPEYTVVVMSVPALQTTYTSVFEAAHRAVMAVGADSAAAGGLP